MTGPVLALALAAPAMAEPLRLQSMVEAGSSLKLHGSSRLRYETISGQVRAGLPASEDLINLRTIVGADYGAGPVRAYVELWDSRVYDGEPGGAVSNGESNALEFVQAYVSVALTQPLGPGSSGSLQLGRFMMDLGSRRLIAADDYRNTTNGSTGVRLDLKTKSGWSSSFFYTLPQTRRPEDQAGQLNNQVAFDRESFDVQLWGAFVARTVPKLGLVETSFVAFDERDGPRRPTRDRSLRNVGARLIRAPAAGRFDYEAEGIRQWGSVSASAAPIAASQDVAAWFFHADAGYQFEGAWKTRLSVEYDYGSGDKPGGKYGRFDSLYGQRRADFTPAGLFGAITRTNLDTPGLRVEIQPNKRTDAFVEARVMWLASATDAFAATNVRDATGRSGRYAGEAVDGRIRYWLVPDQLRFEADAVWLRKGRFLTAAPNANRSGDTAYLSLNLTASF